MRTSARYMWVLGIVWVVAGSLIVGGFIGAVLGLIFGLSSLDDPGGLSTAPVESTAQALALAMIGGTVGALYGLFLGGLSGTAATGAFALVMRWRLAIGPVRPAVASTTGAVLAVAVEVIALAIVWRGETAPGIWLWWVAPLAVSALIGAIAGPFIVRGAVRRAESRERVDNSADTGR